MTRRDPATLQRMIDARRERSPYAVSESQSIITQYFRDINALVRQVAQLVKERIDPILDKYQPATPKADRGFRLGDDDRGLALDAAFASIEREFETLQRYAARVATNRMMQANHANRRAFLASWSQTVGVNVSSMLSPSVMVRGRLIDKDSLVPVTTAIRNNVELIKSVPKKQLAKIQKAIEKGIASGTDAHSLKQVILEINGQDTRRAKLIARDQLQKLNGVLVQARQQSIGVNGYIWRTSHDERVRPSHKDNDGKSFQWNSPPRGTGHPGEDINCRCTAEPDLSQIVPSLAPGLEGVGPKQVNRISLNPVPKVGPKIKPKKKAKAPTKKKAVEKKAKLTRKDLDRSKAETEKAREALKVQQAKTEKARKALAETDKKQKRAAVEAKKQKDTVKEMKAKIKKLNAETNSIDRQLAKDDRARDFELYIVR